MYETAEVRTKINSYFTERGTIDRKNNEKEYIDFMKLLG